MEKRNVERFEEITNEIDELLNEAEKIVRQSDSKVTIERMRSYWLAHMRMALTKNSNYLGSSMFTMESTLAELQDQVEDDNSDDSDEE